MREDRIPARSSQSILAYKALLDNGIAYLGGDEWSATWRISDVVYQSADEEQQKAIFSAWKTFINSFEAGQTLQVSIINRRRSADELASTHRMGVRGDGFDWVRRDYDWLLDQRLAVLRQNIVTEKFITVTAHARSADHATTVFSRLSAQVEKGLRRVGGCQAERLGWAERVRLLASLTRPGEPCTATGPGEGPGGLVRSKDVVAPMGFNPRFSRSEAVLLNDRETHMTSLVLRDLPPWLRDKVVAEMAEVNAALAISVSMSPMTRIDSLDRVKQARQGLTMQLIDENSKLEKQGLSERFLPHDLVMRDQESETLLHELETSNEALVTTCLVVTVFARTHEELKEQVAALQTVAKQNSCPLVPLQWMQTEGLNQTLPLGVHTVPVSWQLTSSSASAFIPFTSQDADDPDGVVYGVNQVTHNLVAIDRSSGMNGNAFILGTSGGGKGVTAKNEMTQLLVTTDDDVIVLDPEREYLALGRRFDASVVDVSASSHDCVNPMDLDIDETSGEDPIRQKAVSVLAMLEVLIGGRDGLSQEEKSVVDRCVRLCYEPDLTGFTGEVRTPTLRVLLERLRDQPDPVAETLARKLELFTTGSYSGFANETNVDTSSRFVIYDLHKLESGLQTFGMLVVLDQIWNRIVRNRARHIRTHLYIDEFHLMFDNPVASAQLRSFYQRARKYGLLPTGITQNVSQLLRSEDAQLMLANSNMVVLLPQKDTDRAVLAELKNLSEEELEYISDAAQAGTGLILSGSSRIPFDNRIPDTLDIFKLFSTDFK